MVNWVRYAEGFPTDSQPCSAALEGLNETLADVSVLLGNGFTPSEADAVVFSAVHSSVVWILLHARFRSCFAFLILCNL